MNTSGDQTSMPWAACRIHHFSHDPFLSTDENCVIAKHVHLIFIGLAYFSVLTPNQKLTSGPQCPNSLIKSILGLFGR